MVVKKYPKNVYNYLKNMYNQNIEVNIRMNNQITKYIPDFQMSLC